MAPTLRRLLTPLWILLTLGVVLGVIVFCLLGYWQWLRYQEEGSPQNLAYTLQWPVFAAFGIYMWWRMLRESVQGPPPDEEPAPVETVPAGEPELAAELLIARVNRKPGQAPNGPAADNGDADKTSADDGELAAYNRYLGTLGQAGQKGSA